jgi:hypothetical protein
MDASAERAKLLQEIALLPEDKLLDVYTLLHYFRLGLEAAESTPESVMQFAGCWADVPGEEFSAFTAEVMERRSRAFARRRAGEASAD